MERSASAWPLRRGAHAWLQPVAHVLNCSDSVLDRLGSEVDGIRLCWSLSYPLSNLGAVLPVCLSRALMLWAACIRLYTAAASMWTSCHKAPARARVSSSCCVRCVAASIPFQRRLTHLIHDSLELQLHPSKVCGFLTEIGKDTVVSSFRCAKGHQSKKC